MQIVKYQGYDPILNSFKKLCLSVAFLTVISTVKADPPEMERLPDPAREVSLENARVLILTENVPAAAVTYSRLASEDPLNITLSAEYSYSLALNGAYDVALLNLEKVWGSRSNNREVVFFASQVFALMGSQSLYEEFSKISGPAPQWIAGKAPELLNRFKRQPGQLPAGPDEAAEKFRRANMLTAQGSCLQAMVLFDEITTQYPGEYLPYAGYSIALEKAGLPGKAVVTMETALSVTEGKKEMDEERVFLEKRLATLRKNEVSGNQVETADYKREVPIGKTRKMMAYAGGMIGSGYTSVNSRFGYFLSDNGNASVDMGLSSASGSTSYNLGISYFQRRKIFVAGFGLNGNFNNTSTAAYLKISVGFSFLDKKRGSSWDIFWDGQAPFSKTLPTTVGFSFGRSLYFGKR